MAKKKRLVPIIAVISISVLFVIGFFLFGIRGYGCSVGRYLEASDGSSMVVVDNEPVQMSNQTNWKLFDGLDTGDKIWVVHDGMENYYPGRTGVYAILKLSDGNIDDIPQTVVNQLAELGWL